MRTFYANNAFPGWREKAVVIVQAPDRDEALRLINEKLASSGRRILPEQVHEVQGVVFLNGPPGFRTED